MLTKWIFKQIFARQYESVNLQIEEPSKIYNLNCLMNGHITLICGPMFAGKSSEMLRKVRRHEHANRKCLLISYEHDKRYSDNAVVSTHDKISKKALRTDLLSKVQAEALTYNVVGIDEGQFFADIVEFCELLANNGIIVLVAALDSTFERKPFGNIYNLIPRAEEVIKLSAVCSYCNKEASFTKRLNDSKQIQLIGGADIYKPVCRKCFFSSPPTYSCIENVEEEKKVTEKSFTDAIKG